MTNFTRTDKPAADVQKGDLVSYEDIANQPARFFTVLGTVTDRWGTDFEIVDLESGQIRTSDLRQHGWKMAERH